MSRALPRKKSALVPIADWRVALVHAPTISHAGRFVANRYGVEPFVAETIASLAGLGNREDKHGW